MLQEAALCRSRTESSEYVPIDRGANPAPGGRLPGVQDIEACSNDDVRSVSAPSTITISSPGSVVTVQVPTKEKVVAQASSNRKQTGGVPRFVGSHVEAGHSGVPGA
ncbi:hypothetical protein MTO96_035663 [Rhipicephalus appendiculatus]